MLKTISIFLSILVLGLHVSAKGPLKSVRDKTTLDKIRTSAELAVKQDQIDDTLTHFFSSQVFEVDSTPAVILTPMAYISKKFKSQICVMVAMDAKYHSSSVIQIGGESRQCEDPSDPESCDAVVNECLDVMAVAAHERAVPKVDILVLLSIGTKNEHHNRAASLRLDLKSGHIEFDLKTTKALSILKNPQSIRELLTRLKPN